MERADKLSSRQFTYKQGRGKIDAVKNFVRTLNENKVNEKHQVMIALDLSDAFNDSWKPYIRKQLELQKSTVN